eukprot:1043520-Pyramimonas_sp.AAC.1
MGRAHRPRRHPPSLAGLHARRELVRQAGRPLQGGSDQFQLAACQALEILAAGRGNLQLRANARAPATSTPLIPPCNITNATDSGFSARPAGAALAAMRARASKSPFGGGSRCMP